MMYYFREGILLDKVYLEKCEDLVSEFKGEFDGGIVLFYFPRVKGMEDSNCFHDYYGLIKIGEEIKFFNYFSIKRSLTILDLSYLKYMADKFFNLFWLSGYEYRKMFGISFGMSNCLYFDVGGYRFSRNAFFIEDDVFSVCKL